MFLISFGKRSTLKLSNLLPDGRDPLNPHFYIVLLGFTEVYIILCLFLLKNIDCGYSLELHRQGGSNE